MKTEELPKLDKEGYLLLPREFEDKGFSFIFIKDLDADWKIYQKNKGKSFRIFELVKPAKQKEFVIGGNIVPKKWQYPSSESWGIRGFSCFTISECESRHKKLLEDTEKNRVRREYERKGL